MLPDILNYDAKKAMIDYNLIVSTPLTEEEKIKMLSFCLEEIRSVANNGRIACMISYDSMVEFCSNSILCKNKNLLISKIINYLMEELKNRGFGFDHRHPKEFEIYFSESTINNS